jgi:hypothetical protein
MSWATPGGSNNSHTYHFDTADGNTGAASVAVVGDGSSAFANKYSDMPRVVGMAVTNNNSGTRTFTVVIKGVFTNVPRTNTQAADAHGVIAFCYVYEAAVTISGGAWDGNAMFTSGWQHIVGLPNHPTTLIHYRKHLDGTAVTTGFETTNHTVDLQGIAQGDIWTFFVK